MVSIPPARRGLRSCDVHHRRELRPHRRRSGVGRLSASSDRRVLVLETGPAHWSPLIRMPLGEVFTVGGVHDLHRGQGGTDRSRARVGLA